MAIAVLADAVTQRGHRLAVRRGRGIGDLAAAKAGKPQRISYFIRGD